VELIDQQLREFEDAGQQFLYLILHRRVSARGGHFQVVIPYHGDATRGWNTDNLSILKNIQKVVHQRDRFAAIPRVVMHLATACLGLAKFDGMPEPFENSYNCFACIRKQRVVVAGDKKRDKQRCVPPLKRRLF
jgi:hypothetical protein